MRLDHSARPASAVRHRRRDRQLAAAAHPHALHARIPAGNDLPLAELEGERLAAIPRRVELLARPEGDADVVDADPRALDRLVALADDDVLDDQVERDVAFGLFDLGTFE